MTWEDQFGNTHDLDFVIERNGTDETIGSPVAFIEVAWRRYTKHSRNKAQEIQGAILPLAEKYKWNNPFLGTVLAGVFTDGSLDQLRSMGFQVLYFPYDTLVAAFQTGSIDIRFDESTPDETFRETAEAIENIPPQTMIRIKEHLVNANRQQMKCKSSFPTATRCRHSLTPSQESVSSWNLFQSNRYLIRNAGCVKNLRNL